MITAQNPAQIFASGVGTSYIQQNLLNMHLIDLSTVFFQFYWWTSQGESVDSAGKSTFKIRNLTKFKNDLLKTNKDIDPKSREILQMFVRRGHKLAPPPPHKRV